MLCFKKGFLMLRAIRYRCVCVCLRVCLCICVSVCLMCVSVCVCMCVNLHFTEEEITVQKVRVTCPGHRIVVMELRHDTRAHQANTWPGLVLLTPNSFLLFSFFFP